MDERKYNVHSAKTQTHQLNIAPNTARFPSNSSIMLRGVPSSPGADGSGYEDSS